MVYWMLMFLFFFFFRLCDKKNVLGSNLFYIRVARCYFGLANSTSKYENTEISKDRKFAISRFLSPVSATFWIFGRARPYGAENIHIW